MRKCDLINLYKHNIVHKNVRYKQIKSCSKSCIAFILIMLSFTYLYKVNSVFQRTAKVFNPISELYRDVEVASFVDSTNVNFIVPIKTDSYIVNSDNIAFKVSSSIMVYAPANGIVDYISSDYEKVIKIKHSNELFSIIKNIDIVGVRVGDAVKQGKEIATARPGQVVSLYIEMNGKVVDGLYLNKSFVKWKAN